MTEKENATKLKFEEVSECFKQHIKEYFSTYKNRSDGEDRIEVCLMREGYRTVIKAEEEINRQKAENSNLSSDLTSLKKDLTSAKAEIERLKEELAIPSSIKEEDWFEALKTKEEIKAEAIKEFVERLCEDRVSNDPVVIAVKAELKEMVGEK